VYTHQKQKDWAIVTLQCIYSIYIYVFVYIKYAHSVLYILFLQLLYICVFIIKLRILYRIQKYIHFQRKKYNRCTITI